MALPIPYWDTVRKCKCKLLPQLDLYTLISFKTGRHYHTKCSKSWRIRTHNCVRDKIADMYSAVRANYGKEYLGLYRQLTSYGEHKPADILVHSGSVHQEEFPGKAVALDVAITDPTTATSLGLNSHQKPLVAAVDRHNAKLNTHKAAQRQAIQDGIGPLPFEKAPIVMETSGAFSNYTQNWFKKMVRIEKAQQAQFGTGVFTSRRLQSLDWTWSANSFSSWHLQSISMAHARLQAQAVNHMISECEHQAHWAAPNG